MQAANFCLSLDASLNPFGTDFLCFAAGSELLASMENEKMRLLGSPSIPSTPGTPSTPTPGTPASSGLASDANGRSGGRSTGGPASNPSMAGLPQDSKTREEILRERYQKGLRKRKCTVCGNTARARCPYSSCKTCCVKAKNPCSVHVLKQSARKAADNGSVASHPSPSLSTPSQSEQPWLGQNMPPAMGSGYLRSGYNAPPPFNLPAPYRGGTPLDASTAAAMKFMGPGNWSWNSSPASEQQDLLRQRSIQAALQRETMLAANAWRLQKLKDHSNGEMLAEDEAFDRYMKNASLMDEVFSIGAQDQKGIDAHGRTYPKDVSTNSLAGTDTQNGTDSSLLDGMRSRVAADSQKKASSRKRLNHVIENAVRKLGTANQDQSDLIIGAEEDDLQPLERRWETKRQKSLTDVGNNVVKTMQAFEGLLDKVKTIKTPEDVQMCMDLYKARLGGNLTYLIPNLYPREVAESRNSSGNMEKALDEASPVVPETSAAVPTAAPLNQLSSLYSQSNAFGQVGEDSLSTASRVSDHSGSSYKVKERPWDTPAGKYERLRWHHNYSRGMGCWKVYAHDDSIRSMCFERANANTTILEL